MMLVGTVAPVSTFPGVCNSFLKWIGHGGVLPSKTSDRPLEISLTRDQDTANIAQGSSVYDDKQENINSILIH